MNNIFKNIFNFIFGGIWEKILSIVDNIIKLFNKSMGKFKNIKVDQKSEIMKDIKGVSLDLKEGEDIHIKNMEINQEAKSMNNVVGLEMKARGNQSARLQGVRIKQPHAEIIISDNPNVKVEFNKKENK